MNINRCEIWRVNLELVKSHEYQKTRPVVIVNTNDVNQKSNFELRIVVSIVGWKSKYEHDTWIVKILPSPKNN